MWNNRYYTLKDMVITLVILLSMFMIAKHQYITEVVKSEKLEMQIESMQTEIDSYKILPNWLVTAYNKCDNLEVPENFLKECVAYEIKFKN